MLKPDNVSGAAALNESLQQSSPQEIIATALRELGRKRLALVSSFGTESAALLKVASDVDRSLPVIFLDTGWMFEETLRYRETLIARLGLRDVRTITPMSESLAVHDGDGAMWSIDPDRCCALRKVAPLKEALAPFAGWINGRKRFQGAARADIPVVEADGARLKFNPFARISAADIRLIFATAGLPPHPLAASGFSSVGCMPCTSRSAPGDAPRDGRWRGRVKTECGIHTSVSR